MTKLEQITTSLELSKRLAEWWKDDGLFWWVEWNDDLDHNDEEYAEWRMIEYHKKEDYPRVVFCNSRKPPEFTIPPKSIVYPARTSAELLSKLPQKIIRKREEFWLCLEPAMVGEGSGWAAGYRNMRRWNNFSEHTRPVEALGLLFLQLKENKWA